MDTFTARLLNGITKFGLYLTVFLIPIFYLPFTDEKLELNKYFLLYFLIFVSLLCWLGRSLIKKSFEIRRTPLDIPLLAIWFLYFLTALLSQDKFLSFFGDFSFLGLSFFGLTVFAVFYFLIVQNLLKISQILGAVYLFLFGGTLSAAYWLLFTFKLFDWPSFLPKFNLVNGSNTLFGVYLAVIFVMYLAFLTVKKRELVLDVFFLLCALINLVALVVLGFKLIWIITAAAIFLMLVFFLTYAEKVRTVWISIAFTIFVISLLFIFLGVPKFLTANLPLEVSLSSNISWQIATDTITAGAKNFLFGTGPGTFLFDFSQFRPTEFNNNFAWNIRFRQSYNSAFDWLMTTGLLGALAILFLILMVLGLIVSTWLKHLSELRGKKKTSDTEEQTVVGFFYKSPLIFWGLVGSWLTLLIAFFLMSFGSAHWLAFWLLLGLIVSASAHLSKAELPTWRFSLKTTPQYALVTSFGFILIFTAIIVVGIYFGRYFTAEVIFVKALNKPLDQKISDLSKVVEWSPHRVLFQLILADTFLNKAGEIANKTNDVNQVAPLVSSAVQAAKNATDQSPNNVATWEYLSNMYGSARAFAPEANNWTIGALEKALALEPTNPTFYVALGNAKLLEKRYTEAKEDYDKAIALKPNLLMAYVRLAFMEEMKNNISGSIAVLEKGLNYGIQDPGYVFQLGRYYFNRAQKGDYTLAEAAFRKAIILQPNYSDAIFSLGLLYEKTGNTSVALEMYRKVLDLNPGNLDIKKKINALSGGGEDKK
ncbi:MAG: tetratricopeptide repeat protein [Candidatus Magasanikbacteria bacterium]|nr:tetratricopeptide repeat protein [Candidatus Magasanikbacteria bacterium]